MGELGVSLMKISHLCVIVIACVGLAVVDLMSTGTTSRRPPQRARTEIMAMSAALESYKEDNGSYPHNPSITDRFKTNSAFDPQEYIKASEFLYSALSNERKMYFEFPHAMLRTTKNGKIYIVDPWGNPYGYSTLKNTNPESKDGNNKEFDLWSTGGAKDLNDQSKWQTNW